MAAAAATAALDSLKESFQQLATSSKENDLRGITEVPCFGQAADPQSKVWIESSCVDFLDHIEKATQDASFTDNGRIKLIRNRLIGPARDYFNQFAGKTFRGQEIPFGYVPRFHYPC